MDTLLGGGGGEWIRTPSTRGRRVCVRRVCLGIETTCEFVKISFETGISSSGRNARSNSDSFLDNLEGESEVLRVVFFLFFFFYSAWRDNLVEEQESTKVAALRIYIYI